MGYHGWVVVEQPHGIGGQEKQCHADKLAMAMEHRMPIRAPCLAWTEVPRSQVLADEGGQSHGEGGDGRNTKPSTLEYEPQPAMASEPKVLMLDCTTTLAMAMMEFCTPWREHPGR